MLVDPSCFAIFAIPKKPVIMERQFETIFLTDSILHLFDILAVKFDHFLTADANHVIVMRFTAFGFKKITMPIPDRLLDNAAFEKKRYGPIDGAAGDPAVILLN